MLLAWAVLYLITTANASGNLHLQLTSAMFVLSCIILLKMLTGSTIFKNRFIDVTDSFFHFDTLLFTLFTSHNLNTGRNQDPIAYTSVTLSFLVLLFIIFYHVYEFTTLLPRVQSSVSLKITKMFNSYQVRGISGTSSCGNNDSSISKLKAAQCHRNPQVL